MVAFQNLVVRSPRRIRLEFSSAMAAGAFVPSWYTLVCDDSATGNPVVNAALAVPNLTNYVELALDRDLADGAQYTLTIAAGVPALDASTVPQTSQLFYVPAKRQAPSPTVSAEDLMGIIFQEDIAHDITMGHRRAPDGDLAMTTGEESVVLTGTRGLLSEGLPHRVWGANLREFVDADEELLTTLRGKVERQLRTDDRITGAKGNVVADAEGDHFVIADLDLIGQVKSHLRSPINARR